MATGSWAQPVLDKSSDLFPNWADPLTSKQDAEVMKYGYPGTDQLIFRQGYVLSYDAKHRQAHWVCERLDRDSLQGPGKRKNNFREDLLVDTEHRSRPKDYEGTGYDQGHLSPAEDNVASQEQMDESFFMSNMSPQIGIKFNRHYWANLEGTVRDWAKAPEVEHLYVVTGPVYKHLNEQSVPGKTFLTYQVIGPDYVAVPTHFFKVMLAEMKNGEVRTLALLLPHQGIANTVPLSDFLTSIDEVESLSGLDFFNRLPDSFETKQEKVKPSTVWSFAGAQ
ncbi:hypothetical protein ABS71_06540 [bacterium SCN 62-11]|nr:MAG: hypothetical protein ABS71_06540 [bacterium SCN 62-11]